MSDLTEGKKDDSEKRRYDLLPRRALQAVVERLDFGAKRYTPHNWRMGIKYSRLVGATERHLNAFLLGNNIDPDGGLHELSGAAISILMLLEYELEGRREELNDLYISKEDLPRIKLQIEEIVRQRQNLRAAGGSESIDLSAGQPDDKGRVEG